MWGERVLGRGNSTCKGPGAGICGVFGDLGGGQGVRVGAGRHCNDFVHGVMTLTLTPSLLSSRPCTCSMRWR